jgi:hypothetical protein
MDPHVKVEQINAYQRHELSAAELLAVDDHLAGCAECRALATGPESGRRLEEALTREEHLTYEELEELALTTELPEHVQHCEMCMAEVNDLRRFRNSLIQKPVRTPIHMTRGWIVGLAAAAVLIIAIIVRYPAEQKPAPQRIVASLRDGGATIGLGIAGNVVGMPEATIDELRDISRAMGTGDLPHAKVLDSLTRGREVLLSGGRTEETSLAPVSPVATAVLNDHPKFTWKTVAGARWYRVAVYGANFEQLAASGEVQGGEWTADKPLPREQALTWTVTASLPSGNVTAPRAPAPEAKFQVLSAEDAARMQAVLTRTPHSDLLILIRANELGLKQEARAAAGALAAANPGSPVAAKLLELAQSDH